MAKRASTERTSARVAREAGELLNGREVRAAEKWLSGVVKCGERSGLPYDHCETLLRALKSARRVAASALTQR